MRPPTLAAPTSGLSLVEVVITCLLVALVAVPLFNGISGTHQQSRRIFEETLASNCGTSLLEGLCKVPFSRLPVILADTPEERLARFFVDDSDRPRITPPPDGYSRLVTVEDAASEGGSSAGQGSGRWGRVKLISVKVVWKPEYLRKLSTRTVVFSTLATDDTEVE